MNSPMFLVESRRTGENHTLSGKERPSYARGEVLRTVLGAVRWQSSNPVTDVKIVYSHHEGRYARWLACLVTVRTAQQQS